MPRVEFQFPSDVEIKNFKFDPATRKGSMEFREYKTRRVRVHPVIYLSPIGDEGPSGESMVGLLTGGTPRCKMYYPDKEGDEPAVEPAPEPAAPQAIEPPHVLQPARSLGGPVPKLS